MAVSSGSKASRPFCCSRYCVNLKGKPVVVLFKPANISVNHRIEKAIMTYDYIKRTYGVSPEPGKVVYHTVTKQWGIIKRESKSASHYVQVTFEGCKHASPCHPTELQYDLPQP